MPFHLLSSSSTHHSSSTLSSHRSSSSIHYLSHFYLAFRLPSTSFPFCIALFFSCLLFYNYYCLRLPSLVFQLRSHLPLSYNTNIGIYERIEANSTTLQLPTRVPGVCQFFLFFFFCLHRFFFFFFIFSYSNAKPIAVHRHAHRIWRKIMLAIIYIFFLAYDELETSKFQIFIPFFFLFIDSILFF